MQPLRLHIQDQGDSVHDTSATGAWIRQQRMGPTLGKPHQPGGESPTTRSPIRDRAAPAGRQRHWPYARTGMASTAGEATRGTPVDFLQGHQWTICHPTTTRSDQHHEDDPDQPWPPIHLPNCFQGLLQVVFLPTHRQSLEHPPPCTSTRPKYRDLQDTTSQRVLEWKDVRCAT